MGDNAMKRLDFIILILLSFLISFYFFRGFLGGLITYKGGGNKKGRKKQSFKAWLFYDNYKNIIPRIFLIWYYLIIFIHLFVLIVGTLFSSISVYLARIYWVDCLWIIIIGLLFWRPSAGFDYERWIEKRRGNKKK